MGEGLLQILDRLTFPDPQVTLQALHEDHGLHPPSIGRAGIQRRESC